MSQLIPIHDILPTNWADLSLRVKSMRDGLFGSIPMIPALDISEVQIPSEILAEIRRKNRRRVRDEVTLGEMTAEGSVFRTDAYFDDQLLEVICSIEDKYEPSQFVYQMVRFIEIFLNESAAFRTGVAAGRLEGAEADQAFSSVQSAIESAKDEDTRQTLEILLLDLTNGGQEPWVNYLSSSKREFLEAIVRRQSI